MAVYFFWQGLVISIILSIVLSIGLTLFLNLSAKRRAAQKFEDDVSEIIEADEEPEKNEKSKSGGFILIGPIPIIFGSGSVRFDKNGFKWALLFFAIVILTFLIIGWAIRFI